MENKGKCAYCSGEHDKRGKYCSDACKQRDYRRRQNRNASVTDNKRNVTVTRVTDMFKALPFDVQIQINAIARDKEDWRKRVVRATAYQGQFPNNKNTGAVCSCSVCGHDVAVPTFE